MPTWYSPGVRVPSCCSFCLPESLIGIGPFPTFINFVGNVVSSFFPDFSWFITSHFPLHYLRNTVAGRSPKPLRLRSTCLYSCLRSTAFSEWAYFSFPERFPRHIVFYYIPAYPLGLGAICRHFLPSILDFLSLYLGILAFSCPVPSVLLSSKPICPQRLYDPQPSFSIAMKDLNLAFRPFTFCGTFFSTALSPFSTSFGFISFPPFFSSPLLPNVLQFFPPPRRSAGTILFRLTNSRPSLRTRRTYSSLYLAAPEQLELPREILPSSGFFFSPLN